MPSNAAANASLLDELACQNVVVRFMHALDTGDGATAAALFAADGVWRRQGKDVVGHAAIQAAIAARPPGVVLRHHLTNIRIDLRAPDSATGESYYCLYRAEVAPDARPPYPIAAPTRSGVNRHAFVRRDGRWLMTHNEAHPIFAFK